jgi:general secretion pathway protein D
VKTVLDAVSGITNVNVVSAPSLMVLDNKRAILQVGDQVPIVTQTARAVADPGSPIVNNITFRDTGVILAVTPRVNDAGRVVLEIEQEVSNVARTTSSGIDSPTIQQRRIKTTVAVADGEMLALGGLIQERDNSDRTQVPILGNFPVLGAAFRSKTDTINRTELLVIIRPLVVRDAGEGRAVTEEFRRRLNLQAPASKVGRDSYDRDARRILH